MFKISSGKYFILIFLISIFSISCNKYNKEKAYEYIVKAKNELNSNNFQNAKNILDSLHSKYPKAFEERKYALELLDTIRNKENDFVIKNLNPQIDSIQRYVNDYVLKYNREKQPKYQDQAIYTDKNFPTNATISGLYPGVYDNGSIYLTNVYIGASKHNKIQIVVGKDTIFSKPLLENGGIHRFSDLGKNYEIMTITSDDAKKIAEVLSNDSNRVANVYLIGSQRNKIQLSEKNILAIKKAYNLSSSLLLLDSLKTEREKAEYRNYYIDNGR